MLPKNFGCQLRKVGISVVILALLESSALSQSPAAGMKQSADNEYQAGAVLWVQTAAEYRALAYQAFSLAQLRLDQRLRKTPRVHSSKPPAVIVDIDETVLDNSRFQAELVLRGMAYSNQNWSEWCARGDAGAVPGAVDFLKYASRRGVHIFYITNRREADKPGTVANLQRLGFPQVSGWNVVVRADGSVSSKESRRELVRSRHNVLLLVGDNLNDFNDEYANKSIAERRSEVDNERSKFGVEYIVLPNPMYGDWENAINENKSNLSEEQKRTNRRAAMTGVTLQPNP